MDVVVWKDVPVRIRHKVWHVRKIGGTSRNAIINDYGDVPVARHNPQTGKWEEVVNTRGMGYGARKRQTYRSRHRDLRQTTTPL